MSVFLPDHKLTKFKASPSKVGEELYKRLLAKKPEHFLLQEEAEEIGISAQFLAQIIRGQAGFSNRVAEQLAAHLGETTEYWTKLQETTFYREGKKGNPRAGQKIKQRVQVSNMTTSEAAKRLKISVGYLYHIFAGRVKYSKEFAKRFSRIFGGGTPSQWMILQDIA